MDYAADKRPSIGNPRHSAWQQPGSGRAESQCAGAITIDEKTDWTSLLKGRPSGGGRSTACPGRYLCQRGTAETRCLETLSPKLAPAEDVRGALALVERNEAPLGIVYGSDAVASKG